MEEKTEIPVPMPASVGRKVWYWDDGGLHNAACEDVQQPFDATVVFVHGVAVNGHELVNLSVTDHAGNAFVRQHIQLRLPGSADSHNVPAAYATWMPFQVGQARKLAGTGDLNNWEEQFVKRIVELTGDGKNTSMLTEAQVTSLEQIHDKHFGG